MPILGTTAGNLHARFGYDRVRGQGGQNPQSGFLLTPGSAVTGDLEATEQPTGVTHAQSEFHFLSHLLSDTRA